jgi:hypothetical protein
VRESYGVLVIAIKAGADRIGYNRVYRTWLASLLLTRPRTAVLR